MDYQAGDLDRAIQTETHNQHMRSMAYFSSMFPLRIDWQECRRYVQLPVTIIVHSERRYLAYEKEMCMVRLFAMRWICAGCQLEYSEPMSICFRCFAKTTKCDPVHAVLAREYSVWEKIKKPFVRYYDAR